MEIGNFSLIDLTKKNYFEWEDKTNEKGDCNYFFRGMVAVSLPLVALVEAVAHAALFALKLVLSTLLFPYTIAASLVDIKPLPEDLSPWSHIAAIGKAFQNLFITENELFTRANDNVHSTVTSTASPRNENDADSRNRPPSVNEDHIEGVATENSLVAEYLNKPFNEASDRNENYESDNNTNTIREASSSDRTSPDAMREADSFSSFLATINSVEPAFSREVLQGVDFHENSWVSTRFNDIYTESLVKKLGMERDVLFRMSDHAPEDFAAFVESESRGALNTLCNTGSHAPFDSSRYHAYYLTLNENHATLVFVDKEKSAIEYYNSFGNCPEEVEEALKQTAQNLGIRFDETEEFTPFSFTNMIDRELQNDYFQCGVWIMFLLECRLKFPEKDFLSELHRLSPAERGRLIANYRIMMQNVVVSQLLQPE